MDIVAPNLARSPFQDSQCQSDIYMLRIAVIVLKIFKKISPGYEKMYFSIFVTNFKGKIPEILGYF
jgi:hypothetical protein